jgi:hypothetical protein
MIGFVAVGAGVVSLGAAGIFALRAGSKEDEARGAGCDGTTCPTEEGRRLSDDADTARTTANWLGGIGALAAVGGLVLVLTAPSPDGSASVRLAPSVTARGAGAQIGGTW